MADWALILKNNDTGTEAHIASGTNQMSVRALWPDDPADKAQACIKLAERIDVVVSEILPFAEMSRGFLTLEFKRT